MGNKILVLTFVACIFVLGTILYLNNPNPVEYKNPEPPKPKEEEQVFCTQDAKMCEDGSYVGRVGPNCEFAPCKELE